MISCLAMFEQQSPAFDPCVAGVNARLSSPDLFGRYLSGAPQSRQVRRERLSRECRFALKNSPTRSEVNNPSAIPRHRFTLQTAFAETGVDVTWARARPNWTRFETGNAQPPTNLLHPPLQRREFYALAVWPADIAVSTELTTDAITTLSAMMENRSRYLCLRQSYGFGHGGQLSGSGYDARSSRRICLSRGDPVPRRSAPCMANVQPISSLRGRFPVAPCCRKSCIYHRRWWWHWPRHC